MSTQAEKLDLLLQDGATIKEQLIDLKYDVNQLNKHVFVGNGSPSLVSRVSLNESLLAELTWFRRAAIAGFCTSVVSVAVLIISAAI